MASTRTARRGGAKSLLKYRAKRDFERTSEPRGDRKIRPAQFPRFVIQKHDATRLHYDLRLEVDGVFKSWAVTRGPSLDPAEKRLAVEVEDHPLDYGDFEGTIPKGQYGGGAVMVWDRGFWSPLGDKSVEQALSDGELKFNVAGEKLKGSFVLVRMKRDRTGGNRANWLLIKHRDQWAKPGKFDVLRRDRSVASQRTMTQIAAGQGDGPTPFITARRRPIKANAVWHSANLDGSPPSKPRKKPASALPVIRPVKASGNSLLGVKISNAAKPLWPSRNSDDAVTKLDLAEYLATVEPWMMDHLRGRPCSLLRAPDGIERQTFFQRHAMAGASAEIGAVKIDGDHEPYLQIESVKGLVEMGQLAALEFHPWNCAPFEPAVPGRLVFDLDPAPDVEFSEVVDAAKELKERLDALGLHAFCKTTGGKGLHVVTPLARVKSDSLGWGEAKMFAEAVCAQMADDSPSKYLIKMTKTLRKGRIFLDYLRNDRTATAVAPLSPRARPGAPVSMPVTWRQVRADLDPMRFTIRSAPALLAKSAAWRDYDAAAQPLRKAIKKLVGGAR